MRKKVRRATLTGDEAEAALGAWDLRVELVADMVTLRRAWDLTTQLADQRDKPRPTPASGRPVRKALLLIRTELGRHPLQEPEIAAAVAARRTPPRGSTNSPAFAVVSRNSLVDAV